MEAQQAELDRTLKSVTAERDGQLTARQRAEARQAELDQQLRTISEEHGNLKELHGRVTEQAKTLATEWTSRRQAIAADNKRLQEELQQMQKTLELSRDREKQWQQQVRQLQDDVRALRQAATQAKRAA
jgi:chromosome segregation ATPase